MSVADVSKIGTSGRGQRFGLLAFIFDKIEGAIQSLGGKLEDVVRIRIFIKNINQWETIARAHGQRFVHIQPVNTMVQANLIGEEYLVEIEAEAIVE